MENLLLTYYNGYFTLKFFNYRLQLNYINGRLWGGFMDNDILWEKVLNVLKEKMSPISFTTWVKETKIHTIINNKLYIIVPMMCHKLFLQKNYYELIDNVIYEFTNINYELLFITEDEIIKDEKKDIITYNNSNNIDNNLNSNLISKYTFENFIVGDSNRFAHTAAVNVSKNPGIIYNPLFIYGKSGLGKTHLMHAIGNYIIKNSNKKVLYITCDDFIHEFIDISSKNDTNDMDVINSFKNKYRNIDVLIIDDIQFLGGASKTQQEFFHTFNFLHSSDKQIIISSDKSPDDLKLLEERLRTRFSWGLTVNIYPPDYELRCKIIKNKISGHEVAKIIDDDVIEYMANACDNDVRHIEGAVTRLYVYAAMVNPKKIDLQFAMEALNDFVKKSVYNKNDVTKIMQAVSNYYKITLDDLKSKKRSANINYPRQIAMYLCRMMTDESFPRLGDEFGGRDHTTIMHGCEKIEREIKKNSSLNNIIKEIKDTMI